MDWGDVTPPPPPSKYGCDVIFEASALVSVAVKISRTRGSPVVVVSFFSVLVSFHSHVFRGLNNEEQQICPACIFLSVSAPMHV